MTLMECYFSLKWWQWPSIAWSSEHDMSTPILWTLSLKWLYGLLDMSHDTAFSYSNVKSWIWPSSVILEGVFFFFIATACFSGCPVSRHTRHLAKRPLQTHIYGGIKHKDWPNEVCLGILAYLNSPAQVTCSWVIHLPGTVKALNPELSKTLQSACLRCYREKLILGVGK